MQLALLAAHMAGDYILQTDWMAREKFTNPRALVLHCLAYTLAFAPLLLVGLPAWALPGIFASHLVIDSRRWASPKPWPPKPILVDQSLHAVVLAALSLLIEPW